MVHAFLFYLSRITFSHILAGIMSTKSTNIQEAQRQGDFAIKPEGATPTLNTADWPLLLKVCTQDIGHTIATIALLQLVELTPNTTMLRLSTMYLLTAQIELRQAQCPHRSLHPHPQRLLSFET